MGFTTGLLGGITLTTATLYLTISLHNRARLHQSALLRQQAFLLTNIVEPVPIASPPRAREARGGLAEMAKDRWNGEVEGLVRRAQSYDWNRARERVEEGAVGMWERVVKRVNEGASK